MAAFRKGDSNSYPFSLSKSDGLPLADSGSKLPHSSEAKYGYAIFSRPQRIIKINLRAYKSLRVLYNLLISAAIDIRYHIMAIFANFKYRFELVNRFVCFIYMVRLLRVGRRLKVPETFELPLFDNRSS
jgi:hypothetical protein